MEARTYMIPGVITVSRETGKVISVERVEADEATFRRMCRWILEAHGLHEAAERIREEDTRRAV